MIDEDFEAPTTMSMSSFGRKDPDLSVNYRLNKDYLQKRPHGMPPFITREAGKQLKELDEMKEQNRLHELSDMNSSRSTLNHSFHSRGTFRAPSRAASTNTGFGRKPYNQAFARNYRNDAIGNRSVKSEAGASRDLRQMLVKTLAQCKGASANESAATIQVAQKPLNTVEMLLRDKTISEYVEVINKNFGTKHDMAIQKEIAALQKKPFLYACGSANFTFTQDGSGISGPKMKAISTKSTMNCRFSHL